MDKKNDVFDFGDAEKVLFDCHTVTGSGIKEANKIFDCWNRDDIPRLDRFNQQNRGYVLLFSSRLTRGMIDLFIEGQLSYRNFSNASVLVEIQDVKHAGDSVAHLGGQLDETGKFFGVLNYGPEYTPNLELFGARKKKEFGADVYQGRVKAIASERQDRMQVIAID